MPRGRTEADIPDLNRWISRFITEVWRQDGNCYPPKTIHQLLASLQRYMLKNHPEAPRFLDRKDICFRDIHGTCETIYRQLHQDGVGTAVWHAAVITSEEEDKLSASGAISITSPKTIQCTVFYYICKVFCIRGEKSSGTLDHPYLYVAQVLLIAIHIHNMDQRIVPEGFSNSISKTSKSHVMLFQKGFLSGWFTY